MSLGLQEGRLSCLIVYWEELKNMPPVNVRNPCYISGTWEVTEVMHFKQPDLISMIMPTFIN